jgi:hypothetical protein
LDPKWRNSVKKGARILFWTLLFSPFLMLIGEFFMTIGLALSGSENAAATFMSWENWAPMAGLLIGLVSIYGLWHLTSPRPGRLGPQADRRRVLLRPLALMVLAVLLLQAASGLSGYRLQGSLFVWVPRIVSIGFAVLLLIYLADLADIFDQYPLAIVALTMAAFFACILFCDVLDLIFAGTDFGLVVLPVVAMGKLALALVSMSGLLIVTGKTHRLLKTARGSGSGLEQSHPLQDPA